MEDGMTPHEREVVWRRDLRHFIIAAKKHWVEWVSGGLVATFIGVFGNLGFNLPPYMTVIFAFCGAVVMACFAAFQDERRKGEEMSKLIQTQKGLLEAKRFLESMKVALARLLEEGRLLQRKCSDYKAPFDEANEWNNRVDAALSLLGETYVARYRSDVGIPFPPQLDMRSEKHEQVWYFLHDRMYRLQEFMSENQGQ